MSNSSLPSRAITILKDQGMKPLLEATKRHIHRNHIQESYQRNIEPKYLEMKYKLKYGASAPNRSELIQINPQKVTDIIQPTFRRVLSNQYATHILDGDWDQNRSDDTILLSPVSGPKEPTVFQIENVIRFQSFRRHFNQNVPWNDTEFFRRKMAEIEDPNLENSSRYSSKDKFEDRLSEVDELYKSMKEHGYLGQDELNQMTGIPGTAKMWHDEVRINIGRAGELIVGEGRHRFMIARILGFDQIPVRVFVRHQLWQLVRQEYKQSDGEAKISKQDKTHPDLQYIVGQQ